MCRLPRHWGITKPSRQFYRFIFEPTLRQRPAAAPGLLAPPAGIISGLYSPTGKTSGNSNYRHPHEKQTYPFNHAGGGGGGRRPGRRAKFPGSHDGQPVARAGAAADQCPAGNGGGGSNGRQSFARGHRGKDFGSENHRSDQSLRLSGAVRHIANARGCKYGGHPAGAGFYRQESAEAHALEFAVSIGLELGRNGHCGGDEVGGRLGRPAGTRNLDRQRGRRVGGERPARGGRVGEAASARSVAHAGLGCRGWRAGGERSAGGAGSGANDGRRKFAALRHELLLADFSAVGGQRPGDRSGEGGGFDFRPAAFAGVSKHCLNVGGDRSNGGDEVGGHAHERKRQAHCGQFHSFHLGAKRRDERAGLCEANAGRPDEAAGAGQYHSTVGEQRSGGRRRAGGRIDFRIVAFAGVSKHCLNVGGDRSGGGDEVGELTRERKRQAQCGQLHSFHLGAERRDERAGLCEANAGRPDEAAGAGQYHSTVGEQRSGGRRRAGGRIDFRIVAFAGVSKHCLDVGGDRSGGGDEVGELSPERKRQAQCGQLHSFHVGAERRDECAGLHPTVARRPVATAGITQHHQRLDFAGCGRGGKIRPRTAGGCGAQRDFGKHR